jgi:hypothetical protein
MTKNSRYRAALLSDIQVYQCGQIPSSIEMEESAKLENWSTADRRHGDEFVLVGLGDVAGHPEIDDGQHTQTSAIVWFDRKRRFVRTTNRMYVLGQPASDNEGIDA